jgi:hypothetical protein
MGKYCGGNQRSKAGYPPSRLPGAADEIGTIVTAIAALAVP